MQVVAGLVSCSGTLDARSRNAAETEGRVLIGVLGAPCQGNCAREAKRKRLIPLTHNECVHAH